MPRCKTGNERAEAVVGRQAGAQADCRVVVAARPAAAILEHATASGADLIALATHGRGGLSDLLAGSVADKVIRSAAAPLLITRPPEHG